jgi:hypothetical protein
MARRPPLTEAVITRPSQTLPPPVHVAETGKRSPARQGKKAVAFWVDPGASTQLRVSAARMNRTVQDIMTEALEDWFRKHRLPELAAHGANGGTR